MEWAAKPDEKMDIPKEKLANLKGYAVLGSGPDIVCLWYETYLVTRHLFTFKNVLVDTSQRHQGKPLMQKRTFKPWLVTTREVTIVPIDNEVTK
ncbi:hypothetical protein ES703_41392 [subsurface metagenome]